MMFFFFFLKSIRLISLRLCGGLEPLTEPSFGVVDPLENNYLNQLTTNCERPVYELYRNSRHLNAQQLLDKAIIWKSSPVTTCLYSLPSSVEVICYD